MQAGSMSDSDSNKRDEAAAPLQQPVRPGPRPGQPVFNLPPSILVALALLIVIFVIQSVVPADLAEWIYITFGFSPLRYWPQFAPDGLAFLWTPVTYSLLHGSIAHIGFNGLWFAIFGTPVVRRIGPTRFVIFWILSSIAAAALHLLLNWGEPSVMVGASGVISGLMGAACRFAFATPVRIAPGILVLPRLTILEALRNRRVVSFTLMWLLGNLIAALGLFDLAEGAIAWDAHIGGFLFGFLLFDLFDPQRRLPAG